MEPYIINIIDWDICDINNKLVIHGYGNNTNNKSIALKILKFTPKFYIKISIDNNDIINLIESKLSILKTNLENLTNKSLYCKLDENKELDELEEELENYNTKDTIACLDPNAKILCNCLKCNPLDLLKYNEIDNKFYNKKYYHDQGKNIESINIVEKMDLYNGFKWDENNNSSLYVYKFIEITFNNLKSFKRIQNNLSDTIFYKSLERYITNEFILINNNIISDHNVKIEFYETNMLPLLQFFHHKNIQPSGWISVDYNKLKLLNKSYFNCEESYQVNFNDINYYDNVEISQFKILSWDIEADSSHLDFPKPNKEYIKQASEIADYYLSKSLDKNIITQFDILNILKKMFSLSINNLTDIELNNIKFINTIYFKDSFNIHKNDRLIDKIEKLSIAIFKICEKYKPNNSYIIDIFNKNNNNNSDDDNEDDIKTNRENIIYKVNNLIITRFGKHVQGDRIIQIGVAFQNYGSNIPYNNIILTLGSCDSFDDTCIIIDTQNKQPKEIINDSLRYDENFIKIIPFHDINNTNYNDYTYDTLNQLEINLILSFKELILQYNPDIILAYNNFGFDNPFIMNRCKELNIEDSFSKISRLSSHQAVLYEKKLKSSALGDNILQLIDIKGRVEVDLMKYIQREYQLESYSLNYVAEHFINENKDDIKPQQIFAFQKIDGYHRSLVAKYCIQDCVLLLNLLTKLSVISNNIGMANICYVPISFIFLRGQGIKIHSLIGKFCMEQNILLKTLKHIDVENDDDCDTYEGAVVLTPINGMYLDDPIDVLDYASLYPNSMIASNISHDMKVDTQITTYKHLNDVENLDFSNMRITLIFEDLELYLSENIIHINEINQLLIDIPLRYQKYPLYDSIYIPEIKKRYIRYKNIYKIYNQLRDNYKNNINLNIDNFNYTSIYFDMFKGYKENKHKTNIKKVTYASHHDGKLGILPQILQILLSKRKAIRKQQVTESDPFIYDILEGYQLSYKKCANSIYGQCGSPTSVISDIDIASSVTAIGRQMLNLCKSFAEQYFNCKVVYGDSIVGDEPLLLRNPNGIIEIKTIDSLCNDNEWEPYENFKPFDTITSNRTDKFKALTNYQVFTDGQWNNIRKVIKHKTNKKIYRVNTHTGCIDVTEDHSLIDVNREKIKPEDCVINKTKLLHSFPTEFPETEIEIPEQGDEDYNAYDKTLYECSKCNISRTAYYYYFDKKTNNRRKDCKVCIMSKIALKRNKIFDENTIKYKLNIHMESYIITEDEAKIWGMFMGDGSCGFYTCKSGYKYSWTLNNNDMDRLKLYKDLLEKVEPMKFKILDTLKSSGVYKLVPSGSISYMVNKYRPLFYDSKKAKLVPTIILNAKLSIRKAFFEGYYDADGSKTGSYGLDKQVSFLTKNKISAQCLYYLAKSIGYTNLSITIDNKKVIQGNNYYGMKSCNNYGKEPNTIKKIIYLRNSDDEYVYDLETDMGIFHAGVGGIQILNTDSIFLRFNNNFNHKSDDNIKYILNEILTNKIDYENNSKLSNYLNNIICKMDKTDGMTILKISILQSIVLSDEIAKLLRSPHDLEYEKTFYPFILFTKKRYIGMLYETDPAISKLKYMGIVLKRRGNANIVKTIYKGIIDTIMKQRNIEASIHYLQDCLNKLLNGEYPMDDLIISKSLSGFYKNRNSIAHAVLADRISDRTGQPVLSNTRIAYAFINIIEKKGQKILQGDRIETPEYILENNISINYSYYITNQLMKPIIQIYDLVMKEPEHIFTDALRIITNKKNKNTAISNWFKPINKDATLKTKINIEKGCIHMTQKSKTVKVKCNRDCINNSNFCEKHNL